MLDVDEKTLIFGDNHSAGANAAWLWINNQSWHDWRIAVVEVAGTPRSRGADEPAFFKPVTPQRPRELLTQDLPVSHYLAEGNPRLVLQRLLHAGLIVLGPKGDGILKAVGIGSTVSWLLARPSAPILMAKSASPVRRVLCFLDGSTHSFTAAETLARLPLVADTEVVIAHLCAVGDRVPASLATAVDVLRAAGAQVELHVTHPDPLQAFVNIPELAVNAIHRIGADLVVAGTQGTTGLRRVGLGSVAGAIASRSDVSVLLATDVSTVATENLG